MAGSEAEERIRAKAEAKLRARHPEARIVHELVLKSGVIRIDLAAILPNKLVLVEIKSERDSLSRLGAQIERATKCSTDVWIVINEDMADPLEASLINSAYDDLSKVRHDLRDLVMRNKKHLCHYNEAERSAIQWETSLLIESKDFPELRYARNRAHQFKPRDWNDLSIHALLDLLWAEELRDIAQHCRRLWPHEAIEAVNNRWPISKSTNLIMEYMNGKQIREAVCYHLGLRQFARSDPPRDWLKQQQEKAQKIYLREGIIL